MKSAKTQSKLMVACIAFVSVVAFLKADYYQPDFFPIGLTGLNYTGYNPPYGNVEIDDPWVWQWSEDHPNAEDSLIFSLGVNCIGCADAYPSYIGSFDTTVCRNQNNYLYKVCIPSFMDDGDSANPEHICIIEFIDITELIDSLIADSLTDSLYLGD
jgi:hypothetical protein